MSLLTDDETTREDIAESIQHLNHDAKRAVCVVAKFLTDRPTDWDRLHSKLNDAITLWELTP